MYIPAGGSRRGLLGTLLSTALTFAFVSFWHGGHEDLWCWAALNWLGVTVEGAVRRLAETPRVRDGLVSSDPARVAGRKVEGSGHEWAPAWPFSLHEPRRGRVFTAQMGTACKMGRG